MPELNPFLNTEIRNLPGYKTYFTILEDGVIPSTSPPTSHSPGFGNGQRGTSPSSEGKISINSPEELLGRGSFGSHVFKGLYEDKKECAVKVVKDTSANVDREIDIMRNLKTSNLIGYYSFKKFDTKTFICMELALTDLWKLFQQSEYEVKFPLSEREICEQLVRGVHQLHQRDIAHGNLTPHNILAMLDETGPVIKITDFGLSCERNKPLDLKEFRTHLDLDLSRLWNAPEIYERDSFKFENYIKADIYSLGCMIAYIMSRGKYEEHIVFLKYLDELREDLFDVDCQVSLREAQALRCLDLVVCMTAPNPDARPSIQCVANYPALWDESKIRNFILAVSGFLSTSEKLGKPHPTILKKKSTNTGYKKRSSPNRQRELIQEDGLARNDNPAQEPAQEPVIISTQGLTQEQTDSIWLRESIRDYGIEFCRKPNWMSLLPPHLLEGLPNKHINYDEKCPISLIRLFRNLTSHFRENKVRNPQLKFILGENEDDLVRFFASYFPLLVPIVYKEAQEYKSTFDLRKEFYNPAEDMNLHQTGTLGAVCGLFDGQMWWVENRYDLPHVVLALLDDISGLPEDDELEERFQASTV